MSKLRVFETFVDVSRSCSLTHCNTSTTKVTQVRTSSERYHESSIQQILSISLKYT